MIGVEVNKIKINKIKMNIEIMMNMMYTLENKHREIQSVTLS